MTADNVKDDIDSAPLNPRELNYLRSSVSGVPPRMILVGGVMAVATGLALVITSPELHNGWSLFGFGVLFVIGLLFTLSIVHDQRMLRADLAGGVKLWREGRVHAAWTSEDSESGQIHHNVEIAIDREPDATPMSFTVSPRCYQSIEKGDRVRIAFSPNGRQLLELIDGDYRYVVVDER